MSIRNTNESGFAVIESVLILIIIAAVIGVGGYVIKQRSSVKVASESSTSSTKTLVSNVAASTSTVAKLAVVNSTSSDITKLISDESNVETNLYKSNDSATLNSINDSNAAATNEGGAYNENDF